MKEKWKPIKEFNGKYYISNLGRVKNIKTKRILKNRKGNQAGYQSVCIYFNKKRYYRYLHRLVAKEFIPNPSNYSQVNHKNENIKDNSLLNLEWCTQNYNNIYGNHALNASRTQGGKAIELSKDGHKKLFPTRNAAARWLLTEINKAMYSTIRTEIYQCCNNYNRKTCYGYLAKYHE